MKDNCYWKGLITRNELQNKQRRKMDGDSQLKALKTDLLLD